MILRLVAAGTRPPQWISDGYNEYAKRIRGGCQLELVEIPVEKRSKSTSTARVLEKEGARMLAAIPQSAHAVALELSGQAWSTSLLAVQLDKWQSMHSQVCLMIGGPDGLSEGCAARANQSWSLSNLTFPHLLVRVLVAEQLYRAWSFSKGHPYHRE
jgi:23S rRNA (pseudouridine1915-N3)-methyltransferase